MTDPMEDRAAAMEAVDALHHHGQAARQPPRPPAVDRNGEPISRTAPVLANPFVVVEEFTAIKRPPIVPYLGSHDGHTVMLAASLTMLIGGPSDASKTLAKIDLAGKLATPGEHDWLGLKVTGGLRVGLVLYPGEGEDEDLTARIKSLVATGAQLYVWDRWRVEPAPLADEDGVKRLAGWSKAAALDVVSLDTMTSFFRGAYETKFGIPEEAHDALAAVRSLAGLPLGFLGTQHTRKRDRRGTMTADELEELSGTFARKVDGAVVLRKDGDGATRRRRVTFAKTRQGPKPEPLIVSLPEDPTAPPRLHVVASATGDVKRGTEAQRIAAFVRAETDVVPSSVLTARFNISDSTLKRRRDELGDLGVTRAKMPWLGGNAFGFGTAEQWQRAIETRLGVTQEAPDDASK